MGNPTVTATIGSARKLRHLAVDIRFNDGVIPGFIVDPVNYALESLNKVRYAVHETIGVLNYNTDKLQYNMERKKQSAEGQKTELRPDMAGVRDRLRSLARATHEQTKTVEQYMEESKEWLVADDWKLARDAIEEARRNLTRL